MRGAATVPAVRVVASAADNGGSVVRMARKRSHRVTQALQPRVQSVTHVMK